MRSAWKPVLWMLVCAALCTPLSAQRVKDAADPLDDLTFAAPELRLVAQHETGESARLLMAPHQQAAFDAVVAEARGPWIATFDRMTGRLAHLEGRGIPWIPGTANDLTGYDLGLETFALPGNEVPLKVVAEKALAYLGRNPDLFGVDPLDLVLLPEASGPVLDYLYFVDFQYTWQGVPVEGAHVVFRMNHGNLVQMGQEGISASIKSLSGQPTLTRETAWDILRGYLGGSSPKDEVVRPGRLLIVPLSSPEALSGTAVAPGSGVSYRLVWEVAFHRPGVVGTWEARVDAHSGELLAFVDANRYGKVHGSAYPTDQPATEVDRPFPYADTGLASPNNYADGGGLFPGNTATSTLTGKYVDIVDNCGPISLTTATGDVDFGASADTDCTTPGTGDAGNTRASRTQYYQVTMIKVKALTYLPGNTWLQGVLVDNVNLNQTCNAYWNYTTINFFRSGGGCWNTGELPGVSLHEWAHGLDGNDGSPAGDKGTGETYGDFSGTLQTHGSCAGGGFFYTMDRGCGNATIGKNCGGYGDCCLNCSGIREIDFAKHAANLPYFAEDMTSNACAGCTPFACSTNASYAGPCGYEGHCESLISSQAMWDLPVRDLVAWGLDVDTAWQLMDRFWYASRPTSGSAYACPSLTTTNGCGTSNYFTTFRVVDDCDGDLSNGTPHASAIYAAFNRHKIACTSVVNTDQTGCCPVFTPATPALTAAAGSNSAVVSWGAVTNATRYFVYRNESACGAGFTKVATVNAPTLTYTDTTVVNGVTYYYRLQAASASDACVTAMSNCATVTPQPCAGAVTLARSLYSCADTVSVTVLDSTVTLPVTAQAWSTTDATVKTITLANTPPGSATYTGTFTTTAGAAGAGQVQVAHGATITVRYTDPDYCGTPNQQVTTTGAVDCQPPLISNVAASNVTGNSARITWTTDEAANSRVTYGLAPPPGTNQDDLAAFVTSHTAVLTGLAECSTYFFSVTSADAATNTATANNGGAYFTFETGKNVNPSYTKDEGAGLPIPDNNSTGATSSLTVPDSKSVVDVNVTVNLTHTYDGDLDLFLIGPDNTSVQLSNNRGGGGDNFTNTVFDDEASTPIASGTAPFTGSFIPDAALSGFDGKNAAGTWSLKAVDTAGVDTGAILNWTLTLLFPPAACGPHGTYQSSAAVSDACSGGAGDANGTFEPGETVTFSVSLANDGTTTLTGVTATVTPVTAGVSMVDGSASYADIAVGASSPSLAPHFTALLPSSLVCGTPVEFSVALTSGQGSWSGGTFSFPVGNPGAPVSNTTPSTDVPKTISDNATVESTLTLATAGTLSDVNVTIGGITHTYDGDLDIYLLHPDGTVVELSTDNGGSGDNFTNTVFDDAAATLITAGTAPFTGTFRPEGSLAALNGKPAAGTWRLRVTDDAGGDVGSLTAWSLTVSVPGTPVCNTCTAVTAPPEIAPGDLLATAQTWGADKATHNWPSNAQATGYKVLRGSLAQLPDLLTATADHCLRWSGPAATCTLSETPAAGTFYWYLVVGTNAGGDGSPGSATAGLRTVSSTGACP